MTVQDLITRLKEVLPNCLLDEESDGEILIYSGFRETAAGTLEPIPEPG